MVLPTDTGLMELRFYTVITAPMPDRHREVYSSACRVDLNSSLDNLDAYMHQYIVISCYKNMAQIILQHYQAHDYYNRNWITW